MCIIIDANQASNFFNKPPKPNFIPIWEWLTQRGGKLVFGGKLANELNELNSARIMIKSLYEAGIAIKIDSTRIEVEDKIVNKLKICTSNDTHIIALARVSNARILCTEDANLETDFKNSILISKPRGKIYKNITHKILLKHHSNCNK